MGVESPVDRVVARSDREALARQRPADREHRGEHGAGTDRPHPGSKAAQAFRLAQQEGEHAGHDPGDNAEHGRTGQIAEVEGGVPDDREQRLRAVHGDEGQVADR
jgi:hypothetical protein